MTHSLPSHEVYAVDVPEVDQFSAQFQYNFFVPDESVSETGGVPVNILSRPGGTQDASFIQFSTTRAPRFVKFNFTIPRLADTASSEQSLRNNVFTTRIQNGSLILDNVDKIVTEDNFATDQYIAVNFHDGELSDKVEYLVSSSYVQHTLNQPSDANLSNYDAAVRFQSMLPFNLSRIVIGGLSARAVSNLRFLDRTHRPDDPETKASIANYFERLSSVVANAQVNSKLFYDVVNRTIQDPNNTSGSDLLTMHSYSKKVKQKTKQSFNSKVTDADFKTFVSFIDVAADKSSDHIDQNGAVIVGYLIDKSEVLEDGTVKPSSPIVIDNPHTNIVADFQVKYGSRYVYSIRTIAQIRMPAIDDDTGQVATIKVLVSSKPSQKVYVLCTESVAPPAPADFGFTWNYERINPSTAENDSVTGEVEPGTGIPGSLLVHWTFPTNSQRDIKKFQVFRRKSTDHPFQLIKMYDFDDSAVKVTDSENPDPGLVEYVSSPCNFFFDDDFTVDSRYIYAIACIDAHGFTSNYSAQFEVWFDQFKNQLQKRLVSHTGAPKPYPNLYLAADTFVDTIRVSGPNSKLMKLYFNPEYYQLIDNDGHITQTVATTQTRGSYKLQFLNLDNQKAGTIDINIDDRSRAAQSTLSFPSFRFGARRKKPQSMLPG